MVPVSNVNKNNYHLLGNRAVGETRRSRMARVNNRTAYTPSLVNQPVSNQVKVKGAKPLGAAPTNTQLFRNPFIHGAGAFAINGGIRKIADKPLTWQDARFAAIASTFASMFPTNIAALGDLNDSDKETGRFLYGILVPLAGAVAGSMGAVDVVLRKKATGKKTIRREAFYGTLITLPLAIPGLLGGNSGFMRALPAYAATLWGIGLSSRYVKGRRN